MSEPEASRAGEEEKRPETVVGVLVDELGFLREEAIELQRKFSLSAADGGLILLWYEQVKKSTTIKSPLAYVMAAVRRDGVPAAARELKGSPQSEFLSPVARIQLNMLSSLIAQGARWKDQHGRWYQLLKEGLWCLEVGEAPEFKTGRSAVLPWGDLLPEDRARVCAEAVLPALAGQLAAGGEDTRRMGIAEWIQDGFLERYRQEKVRQGKSTAWVDRAIEEMGKPPRRTDAMRELDRRFLEAFRRRRLEDRLDGRRDFK